jgi:hypothetical protein
MEKKFQPMPVATVTSINKRQSAMGPVYLTTSSMNAKLTCKKKRRDGNLGLTFDKSTDPTLACSLLCLHTRAGNLSSLFHAPTLAIGNW